ncbi:MAG: CpsD/CapB family tyrosine-protein kinase [Candidatus Omnitrophica bacterium]|nr:CpsD/CapB family tyrosine-protein kinase [Candidatus Omnitrophota bacterium]
MGRITEALKKVSDDRITRIQKKPEVQYVVRRIANTNIEDHIVSFHDSTSPVGEQYKILRTNIQTLKQTKGFKTFAITSSVNGEGKTVTAINLAISMAHDLNTRSVLLIDADMRKSKVAKYLGLESSPGLSDVLKGGVGVDSTFVSPNIENLTIIPSGKMPKNPAELLGSRNMENLLRELKNRFDYIFIDTPPVMSLTDASILGPMTDGVIMIIQAGRTQRDIVKSAKSRLYQARTTTLGYVMTHIEYHLPHYLYRYVHKYSDYAYYKEKEQEAELVAN